VNLKPSYDRNGTRRGGGGQLPPAQRDVVFDGSGLPDSGHDSAAREDEREPRDVAFAADSGDDVRDPDDSRGRA
jgi:hypothetical protein